MSCKVSARHEAQVDEADVLVKLPVRHKMQLVKMTDAHPSQYLPSTYCALFLSLSQYILCTVFFSLCL